MKKLLSIMLLSAIVLFTQAITPFSEAEGKSDITVLVNGKPVQLTAAPIWKEGRVYVPLRSMLTLLGADVIWDAAQKQVTAIHRGVQLQLNIAPNVTTALVDGKEVELTQPPLLQKDTVYVSVRWLNEMFGAVIKWNSDTRSVAVYYPEDELPRVGSYEHLKTLVADAMQRHQTRYEISVMDQHGEFEVAFTTAEVNTLSSSASSAENKTSDSADMSGDYATTNVQVQGVDEADVVKTDGEYIYQVNRERIIITSAMPPAEMNVAAELRYDGQGVTPRELYVDGERLIVIGERSNVMRASEQEQPQSFAEKKLIYPPQPLLYTTIALVYDIHDKQAPKLERELEIEGNYISSRKIGNSLYVISNKYFDYYRIMEEASGKEDTASKAHAVPMIRDSITDAELKPVDYDDIRYFPDFIEPNYMMVASVNLGVADTPMDVQTFLGSGHNVYASKDHLYITVSRYEAAEQQKVDVDRDAEAVKRIAPIYGQMTTAVYKFALLPGSVAYMAEGKVPGTILNQFSMDEHEGHFRIATTVDGAWTINSGQHPSQNNLYILGDTLQEVGKIENIAPGERIYSVRFMGDRAYMVTFRTVDPLFVIDVADPAAPKILGELKIPGYSDYLHPYDENHLIGFGKDTIEIEYKDEKGNIIGTNAYYLGMKVALFDVTDVTNPKELHKEIIGDRGTESELLYNHKALLFSKEKNLLVFPVDLYEVMNKDNRLSADITDSSSESSSSATEVALSWPQFPDYGVFTYQGAYIYSLDPANGFQLRGRITHLSDDERKKAGNWYYGDKSIRRSLYIGDTLYTLSDGMIKANRLSDLSEQGSLDLK